MDNGYKIDKSIYRRFDEKYQMFSRYLWDETLSTYKNDFAKRLLEDLKEEKEGYTQFDYAFLKASWTVYNRFSFAFSWEGDTSVREDWYGYEIRKKKYKPEDIEKFTKQVKKVARFYGASLVGVAKLDERWLYRDVRLPEGIDKAIVMIVKMDSQALSTTPTLPASAATGLGYSKMAFLISLMGEFIRNLGYHAVQAGNDTALSIPLAIDAGLGALGRNGLLVTPEYGSGVRICKVFTDMPLITDQPNRGFIDYLKKFCKNCRRCAEACENNAITFEIEPTMKGETPSNNPGVEKYYINPEKCFEFWTENNSDCSTCIVACPFSKIGKRLTPKEFWTKDV